MAPPNPVHVLCVGVLRVENQKIQLAHEIDQRFSARISGARSFVSS